MFRDNFRHDGAQDLNLPWIVHLHLHLKYTTEARLVIMSQVKYVLIHILREVRVMYANGNHRTTSRY